MPARKRKTYKCEEPKQATVNEPAITYGVDQTALLKLEVMEEIMHLNQLETLRKLLKYLKRIKQQCKEDINPLTLQAMIDAKEGRTIKCATFEDYLKAVQ